MKKKYLWWALAIALILLGVCFFVYRNVLRGTAVSDQYYQSARQALYTSGNLTDVVSQIQQAIAVAPTPTAAAASKIILADALFNVNQGTDREAAAALLKGIIADPSVSAAQRSNAYLHMASWFSMSGYNASVMKNFVFNSAPYDAYVTQANGDVGAATIQLFQSANSLAPSAFAYYQMSTILSNALLNDPVDAKSKQQIDTATQIQQYVNQGDAVLATAGTSSYPASFVSRLYLLRAFSLSTASFFIPAITNQTVDAAYQQAISAASSTDPVTTYANMEARINYAVSLNLREKTTSGDTIANLLAPISAMHLPSIDSYFTSIMQHQGTSPNSLYVQIPQVAKSSPEFKQYLQTIGWNI